MSNYIQLGEKRIEIPNELDGAVLRIKSEENISPKRAIFLLRKECLRINRQRILKEWSDRVDNYFMHYND